MDIRTKSSLRGVREIRTHSGRVDRTDVPYMAFMKISCLEMEKARREKEKQSALTRIENIESRLEEIEVEKNNLLRKLGERTCEPSPRRTRVSKDNTFDEQSIGFRIRY